MATDRAPFPPGIALKAATGSGVAKSVLLVLAIRACRYCGLAWPGMAALVRDTEMSERSLRDGLRRLIDLGAIRIHAYGQGGRHRATIYHVTLGIDYPHVAPCEGHCRPLLRNPGAAAGFERITSENPAPPAGYPSKPGARRPETRQLLPPIYQDPDPPGRGETATPFPDSESTLRIDPSASNGSIPENLEPRDPEWAAALERHGLTRHLDTPDGPPEKT